MERNFFKNLRCPQFIDFLESTSNTSESSFFDCNEYPQNKNSKESSPVPEIGLTEDDENKLVNKMTAALSFIESTPKLKKGVLREKLFAAKAPVNSIKLPEIRQLNKASNVQMLPNRIRSKTVAGFDKICTGRVHKANDFKNKRSSSLSDLRKIKKHTLPKTPLCLKRSIEAKAKAKTLKTTEEMELEQMTELQKQLSKMLKQNEIAYRKLNSKQKPAPLKSVETKPETFKRSTDINADKNSRTGFKSMSHPSIKKVLKLDSIINGNSAKGASSKTLTNLINSTKDSERSNFPSVSSSIMSEESETSVLLPRFQKKSANIGFHSGVFFCNSNKKNTVPKPFTFEARMKQKKLLSSGTDENSEVFSSKSKLNHSITSGKENIPVMEAKSEIKINNMKSYISKNTIGGSNRKAAKGVFFPLSENANGN